MKKLSIVTTIVLMANTYSLAQSFFEDPNGKWGLKDSKGKIIIAPEYEDVEYFYEGKAEVTLNGRTFYIDKKGNEIKTAAEKEVVAPSLQNIPLSENFYTQLKALLETKSADNIKGAAITSNDPKYYSNYKPTKNLDGFSSVLSYSLEYGERTLQGTIKGDEALFAKIREEALRLKPAGYAVVDVAEKDLVYEMKKRFSVSSPQAFPYADFILFSSGTIQVQIHWYDEKAAAK